MTALAAPRQMLIDGAWMEAQGGRAIEVRNPADGALIGTVPRGAAMDVDRAVAAARGAFEDGRWSRLPGPQRARIMLKAAELIEAEAEALAHTEVLDNGMPFAAAKGSALKAAEAFRYFAGWTTKIHGHTAEFTAGPSQYLGYTLREPVGVAGLIIPWNFPLSFAGQKFAVALAAGCSCVMKPAEETPFSALQLAAILMEAGIPPGVVNVVTGTGPEAGAALAAHADVDKVAFTGSTETGRAVLRAAAGNMKKVTLELGGKSPVIVYPDADMAEAIPGAAMGIFRNSGQICVAGSRLYVHRKRFDEVTEGVVGVARALKIGSGFEADTQLGPLVSQRQLDRVSGMVERGVRDGGEIVTGGKVREGAGFYMEPTVIARPREDSEILRDEVFGPVVTVTPFDELEEVVAKGNDTSYGLAAAVWTRDIKLAHRTARALKAGTVWINCELVTDFSMPFGGYKQSGVGREQGWEGLEAYLETKSVYVAL